MIYNKYENKKKENDLYRSLFGSFKTLGLEREAKADEKAVGLCGDVVAGVDVKQTKTITAKQVELVEFHICAEHDIEVETAEVAVVTIPINGVARVGAKDVFMSGGLGLSRKGKACHWSNKWNNTQFTVNADGIIKQNRDVNKELGVGGFDASNSIAFLSRLGVHTELATYCGTNTFGEAKVLGETSEETLVVVAAVSSNKGFRSITCING